MTLRGPVTFGKKAPPIMRAAIAIAKVMAYFGHLGVRLVGERSFLRIDELFPCNTLQQRKVFDAQVRLWQ